MIRSFQGQGSFTNAFSSNLKAVNLKIFASHEGYTIEYKALTSQGLFYKLRVAFGRYKEEHFSATKNFKKGTPNLTISYVHSIITIVLIKQFLKKISH